MEGEGRQVIRPSIQTITAVAWDLSMGTHFHTKAMWEGAYHWQKRGRATFCRDSAYTGRITEVSHFPTEQKGSLGGMGGERRAEGGGSGNILKGGLRERRRDGERGWSQGNRHPTLCFPLPPWTDCNHEHGNSHSKTISATCQDHRLQARL